MNTAWLLLKNKSLNIFFEFNTIKLKNKKNFKILALFISPTLALADSKILVTPA